MMCIIGALSHWYVSFFFFNDTATTEIYTLSLHDALPIWKQEPAGDEHEQLFPSIQFHFAERGDRRTGAKDFHAHAMRPAPPSQPPSEIGVFTGEHLLAESTQGAEDLAAAKDETAGSQFQPADYRIREEEKTTGHPVRLVVTQEGAAANTGRGVDAGQHFSQSACAHVRVGIKKQKPVAGRGARARVSRAGNLVDGFKNDMSSSVARELRGPIGRVVVHHDGFGLEVRTRVGAQGDGETPHATFDVFGFVECRDDDG